MDFTWLMLFLSFLTVFELSGGVEVHFENKDGGFFLKHTPRQHYSPSADLSGSPPLPPVAPPSSGTILSVDRFTVFQNSQPISVRATYGPFSTKQTVPARYIVPDPLDTLAADKQQQQQQQPHNGSGAAAAAAVDMQELSAAATHHLDMSAHVVRHEIPRDSPVLRVLFHTGSDPGGRRRLLLTRHQRVCIVLHAALPGRIPLTSACSPDGEDGVCLAQVTIPSSWWPPLPPPDAQTRPLKSPPRLVQIAYSVLEPREGCIPRVQIQPVTPLGTVPLVAAKSVYKELRADEFVSISIPHVPLFPLSRIHVPLFLQEKPDVRFTMFVVRARVKSGLRILGASVSSAQWNITVELNPKHTGATVTALRRDNLNQDSEPPSIVPNVIEIFTWLLEVVEDSGEFWDGAKIVWSVRYVPNPFALTGPVALPSASHDPAGTVKTATAVVSTVEDGGKVVTTSDKISTTGDIHNAAEAEQSNGGVAAAVTGSVHLGATSQQHEGRRKLTARLEVQKDDIQAVLPISKNWEVMNTAVLTGRQVSQAMKVFIVSQAGKAADVTLQSSCHSEDESVLKVSSSCSSVYVDGSEARGSVNGSVLVKYGTYTGLARFTVWMPEFPLELSVPDTRLSMIKLWKVPDTHSSSSKIARQKRSYGWGGGHGGMLPEDINGVGTDNPPCRLRYQQTPVDVYGRFLATDHDSGRVSYFVSRRTWLRVTDLVTTLLRVSDPRIAGLTGRVLQGRAMGRTEVQVLSPITGRVIGAKEVRVVNDKISLSKLLVSVVSGLQLNISPDSAIENGYIAETSVTRRLTAQYQEGLLDIELEFSDGSRTPLRDVEDADYHLVVESLDSEVVAFAPMVASHHPRVIAVGEGSGDLLKVTLHLNEQCRMQSRTKPSGKTSGPLATATATVQVDFSISDIPHRPDFVQNDGGIPLKDENDHEPTVQARQHHGLSVLGPHGRGVPRHSAHSPHLTPLEIGMYVLLAAFCFAIVVFVVSCVVYASKFKPQGMNRNAIIGGSPLGGKNGSAVGSLGIVREPRKPRPTTMNAHDWVWLGRATLERASGQIVSSARCNNNNMADMNQMRITANPINLNYSEPDDCLITSFDNPNHIELPSSNSQIDTSTYCKRSVSNQNGDGDSVKTDTENLDRNGCMSPIGKNGNYKKPMAVPAIGRSNNNNEFIPGKIIKLASDEAPPLPPHRTCLDSEDYKPPVPPHRNIGVTTQVTVSPVIETNNRKHHKHHHHRRSSGANGASRQSHSETTTSITDPPKSAFTFDDTPPLNCNFQVSGSPFHQTASSFQQEILQLAEKKGNAPDSNKDEETDEAEFVEFPKNGSGNIAGVTVRGSSPEVKRATIVGNPMFSARDDDIKSGVPTTELEDLQLDMDYDQIMHYFDNLKESNA